MGAFDATAAGSLPQQIVHTLALFSRIYLGGIPSTITNDSAYLSFVSMVTATDALAGYRYGDSHRTNKDRFVAFVRSYFPESYTSLAEDVWKLRNGLVHAFSTGPFALMHHESDLHLQR